jgi:hypothetical protein
MRRAILSKNDLMNQSRTAHEGHNTPDNEQDRVANALNAYARDQQAYQAYTAKHNRKIRRWTRAATIGAIIYTLITAFILVTSVYLAKRTRESYTAVQRAFVYPSSIALSSNVESVNLQIVWQNSGNTPTVDLSIYVSGCLMKNEPDKTFTFPEVDERCNKIARPNIINSLLGPKYPIPSVAVGLPIASIPAVNSHDRALYIWGWARYNDIFDAKSSHMHITRVCIAVTDFKPNVTGETFIATYRQCRYGNCADKECEEQGLP